MDDDRITNLIGRLIAHFILMALIYWPSYLITLLSGPIIGYLFFALVFLYMVEKERQKKLARMREFHARIKEYQRGKEDAYNKR